MTLCVVTATTRRGKASRCIDTWYATKTLHFDIVVVENGTEHQDYLGVVAAFRAGVAEALDQHPRCEVIACLHDDLEILEDGWDQKLLRHFRDRPAMGLAGFGGAIGVGADDLYQTPYAPMQLARQGFRSNLVDAEAHGLRSLVPQRVACLDGFSQIGRRAFWQGYTAPTVVGSTAQADRQPRPWDVLDGLGVVHHAYDGMLGCLAARYGWETWFLPIRCHHLGGQTAVGDAGYQQWALNQIAGGDAGFWAEAHRIWYDHFRDVLPLRIRS